MESQDLLEGVGSEIVATPRIETHILTVRSEDGLPVVFVHGNASSSRFFEDTFAALPAALPRAGPRPARLRRLRDEAARRDPGPRGLLRRPAGSRHALGLEGIHLVGWSAGGSVAMQYAMDHLGGGLARAGRPDVTLRLRRN